MQTDFPEVNYSDDIDASLLDAPAAGHCDLRLFRHHFHQVDVANLASNRAAHSKAEPKENHDGKIGRNKDPNVEQEVNGHTKPEKLSSTALVSNPRNPEQSDAPAKEEGCANHANLPVIHASQIELLLPVVKELFSLRVSLPSRDRVVAIANLLLSALEGISALKLAYVLILVGRLSQEAHFIDEPIRG